MLTVRNALLTCLHNKFGSFPKDNLIHIHTPLDYVPKTNAFQLFYISTDLYHLYRLQFSKSNLMNSLMMSTLFQYQHL